MQRSHFLVAMAALAVSMITTSTDAAAQFGGGGPPAPGGGGTGGGTGGGGLSGSGGNGGSGAQNWDGSCGTGQSMVMWDENQYGPLPGPTPYPPASTLSPGIYNTTSNPTGEVYVVPNFPPPPPGFSSYGAYLMAHPINPATGKSWRADWACYSYSAPPPVVPLPQLGFSSLGLTHMPPGTITLPAGNNVLVFDTVTAQASRCPNIIQWQPYPGYLNPNAPAYNPLPTNGQTNGVYAPAPYCPETGYIYGQNPTYVWFVAERETMLPPPSCPKTGLGGGGDYQWTWGMGSATDNVFCDGARTQGYFTHVVDLPPGAYASAKVWWQPECSGWIVNNVTGVTVTFGWATGTQTDAATGEQIFCDNGPNVQNYGPTPRFRVWQVESING